MRTAVNISMPAELKARMDGVSNVNWSKVARAAFEQELARAAERKECEAAATLYLAIALHWVARAA